MGRRERMSSVDTAWLRMDSQANLMQIVGVYGFNGTIEYERLRRLYEERFVPYERFRSCVVRDPTGYYWELDDNFDLDFHVARTALPGKGTTADLKRLVGRLASTALDPNKPLWQVHLVDNYNGGQALIVRIHHCIADGIEVAISRPDGQLPAPADGCDGESDWNHRRCSGASPAGVGGDAGKA